MKDLHPALDDAEKDALLERGIALFNGRQPFAAHEPWEEIWRSTHPEPRPLFQGLVQVAAGLHHFESAGRHGSALRLLERGRGHLEPLAPAAPYGLDLTDLLRQLAAWRRWLVDPAAGEPPPWPILTRSRTA